MKRRRIGGRIIRRRIIKRIKIRNRNMMSVRRKFLRTT